MIAEPVMESTCRHCRSRIRFGVTIEGEWTHPYGGTHCLDRGGFTAMPLRRAEPVLETETL